MKAPIHVLLLLSMFNVSNRNSLKRNATAKAIHVCRH